MTSELAQRLILEPDDNGALHISDVAVSLMSLHKLATFQDTEEVLIYDGSSGLYVHGGEKLIAKEVEEAAQLQHLSGRITRHFLAEVIGHIQRSTYIRREQFNAQPELFLVKNGILNINSRTLLPHSPEYLFTVGIPVCYDPEAKCERTDSFFAEIVSDENLPLLYEIFGWCLDLRSPLQRIVLLIGEGANGKSTLVNLLQTFLGDHNCSHVSMQSLVTNRFSAAGLFGKLANLYPDLPSTALLDVGLLKALTGGDTISAEKKFKDQFVFHNAAKLVFSANQPPKIPEDSLAIWRRLIVVDFPNAFLGDKADKLLIEKLTRANELSGLLNQALDGLARLRQTGDFTYKLTIPQVRDHYRRLSDTVAIFFEERCHLDSDEWETKEELYAAYVAWCEANHLLKRSKKALGIELNAIGIASRRLNGAWVWVGIKLKNQA